MPHVPQTLRHLNRQWIAATAIGWAICTAADPVFGHEPYVQKDSGFFHRASDNVGNFFKRLFHTDEEREAPQPAPAPSKRRSKGQRYSLDQPPSEVRNMPPAGPDRESQPAPEFTPPKEPVSSKAKGKTSAGPASRGSSAAEEPPRSKPKTPKPSEPASGPSVASTENPTRIKPKKPAEPAPSGDPGSVLYSNASAPKPKEPEPPAKVESEPAPTPPPKAPSDSSNVMTGTKTGKSGRVKSPYAPYSELDVTGLPSGSLALDPTTQKVFRIP